AIADAQRRAGDAVDYERLEQCGILFVIEEFGIREAGESILTARCRVQREHAVLVRDQGVWSNQNSFDPTQHRVVRSNTEREAEKRENRKPRCAQKHSRAEAHILNEFIRPSPDALVARCFLDLFDAAELTQRGVSRFGRRHTSRDVSFRYKIDMPLNFFRHFGVAMIFAKQSEQPRKPGADVRHKITLLTKPNRFPW